MVLQDKTALVTGGSRGIGYTVAKRFLQEGANVVITARSTDQLENAAGRLQSLGAGKVMALPGDVSKKRHVTRWIDETLEAFETIDILVNNAGIMRSAPVDELSMEDFQKVLEVNLQGVFLMCNRVVPHMKQQNNGYIFNLASYAGVTGLLGSGAYGASKAGIIRFGETLQREVADYGIKVTSISPAYVYTDMAGDSGVTQDEMIQPDDIVETMLYIMRLSKSALVRNVIMERYGQL